MKHAMTTLLVAITLLASPAVAFAADATEGQWKTNKDDIVDIDVAGGKLQGKLVRSHDDDVAAGTIVLRNFIQKDGVWVGKVYAPKRNRSYDAELKVVGSELSLTVKAGLMKRTVTWKRAK